MAVPKILSNSIIYTGVTILQRGVSFFLLPLYTTYLTPVDYGITGVVGSVSSFLAILTTLGLDVAGNRFYYKYNGERKYVKRLYGTIGSVILINSIIFGGLFIGLHKWIINPLVGEIDFYPFVFLGMINVMVTPLYLLFQSYLQTIQSGLKFGINSMLNFLLQVSLTILLVAYFQMGALGVLWATLITSIVFFVYVIFAFFRHQKIVIDQQILKESCGYSFPLLPHKLANWSNSTVDKLLVNGIRTEADAGLYNLGSQFSSVYSTITIAVNNAYVPWFYERANDVKKTLPQIRRMSEMITWIICFIAVFMSLFSQEVLNIMVSNPAYDGVWRVIPLLICGIIFNSIYFFYVDVLFLKDTGVIFIITVSTIFINVGLNVLLIPIYGFIGCGLASFVTYFAKCGLGVIVSMIKNREIRFRTGYLFAVGIMSSIVCVLALIIGDLNIWMSLSIKSLIITLFAIVVFYLYKTEIVDISQGLMRRRSA